MNRTFWITLVASAAVGITALLGLRARTKDLVQRLADARAGLAPEEVQVPVIADPRAPIRNRPFAGPRPWMRNRGDRCSRK